MATDKPVIVSRRADLRTALAPCRRKGCSVGLVPTMGALHDGHLSLINQAHRKADITVTSIFVNPAQFAPDEDFAHYPRTRQADIAKLTEAGCDIAYFPEHEEIYPDGACTHIRVENLSDKLDGVYRPHFFYGVTTVVARLFIHVQPDIAVFGEKDYQQLQIIRRMVRDLGFPVDIVGVPTVRDENGLAQSSRNAYLSADQRDRASVLGMVLHQAASRIRAGCAVSDVLTEARAAILKGGFDRIDYVSAVDTQDLEDLPACPLNKGQEGRFLVAAWIGATRLIDNIAIRRD